MAKILLEYTRLGLEDASGEILTEASLTFVTEGTVSASDADGMLLEDGTSFLLLEDVATYIPGFVAVGQVVTPVGVGVRVA